MEEEKTNKKHLIRRIINIITTVIFTISVLVLIDVSLVTYFDIGPFLAIPLHTYKDGGSKEFYGLGYKVIKYHQLQGRRDKEIGPWSMKYNVTPIYVDSIDLATEFINGYTTAMDNYNSQLLVVTGVLTKIDNKKVVISYVDENEKYSLDVICTLEDKIDKSLYKTNKEVKVMGKMIKYEKNAHQEIIMKHCFIKQ